VNVYICCAGPRVVGKLEAPSWRAAMNAGGNPVRREPGRAFARRGEHRRRRAQIVPVGVLRKSTARWSMTARSMSARSDWRAVGSWGLRQQKKEWEQVELPAGLRVDGGCQRQAPSKPARRSNKESA